MSKTMSSKHETIKLNLPILVDKNIVNIVKLLNSINGIYTLHSCEGEERADHYTGYVLFVCNTPASLWEIVNLFPESGVKIVLSPTRDRLTMRYTMEFYDKESLLECEHMAKRYLNNKEYFNNLKEEAE